MPPASSEPVVVLQQAAVRLGRRDVLKAVDLAIPPGAIFALIGPNGAGKTTLIKTLLNLHRPSGGSARVLGLPTSSLGPAALTRIGYVSENQELPGWMTLGAFLAYLRPFYPSWDVGLEQLLLGQFHLPLARRLRHLSRGQQMKASLLAALAYRPQLLILDEPFSGLDPLARDEFIRGLLDRAAAEEDHPMTILLSSHDLAELESFATHVAYLNEGRVLFAEEIDSLTQRFREVTVVLPEDATPPPAARPFPASWLLPECSAATCRFVHSASTTEPLQQQVLATFPGARHIEAEPMPLRSIFVALARSAEDRSVPTLAAGSSR